MAEAKTVTRPAAPPAGQEAPKLDEYEVLELVGRGGMASVYLARHEPLDRLVALKELALVYAADPRIAPRFVQESRLSGALSHPNVVTVYDYFEQRGVPYIAMEYLPRGSLRRLVDTLTLAQIVGVLEGVLAGLAAAGDEGIVHCDLKPENILVTNDGRVKIGDFGIARALHVIDPSAGRRSGRDVVIGTPAYMSPEQALGRELNSSSDLYSLGVMAYEMLASRLPFSTHGGPAAVLRRQLEQEPPALRDLRADLDPRLTGWVEALLAKRPEDRPRDARDAWDRLEDIVLEVLGSRWRREASLAVAAVAATAPVGRDAGEASLTLGLQPSLVTRGRSRRRMRRMVAAAVVAVVATTGISLLALQTGDPPAPAPAVTHAEAVAAALEPAFAAQVTVGDALEALTARSAPAPALQHVDAARAAVDRAATAVAVLASPPAAGRPSVASVQSLLERQRSYLAAVETVLARGWSAGRLRRLATARRQLESQLLRLAAVVPAGATELDGVRELARWSELRAPVRLAVPKEVRVTSLSGAPVHVRFRARARRAGDVLPARCRPRSGAVFPVGFTRVICSAGPDHLVRRSFRVLVAASPSASAGAPANGTALAPQATRDPAPQGAVEFD